MKQNVEYDFYISNGSADTEKHQQLNKFAFPYLP